MHKIYIGTFHEDGKEPVIYTVDGDKYSLKDVPHLRSLIKQTKRGGYWTIDENI